MNPLRTTWEDVPASVRQSFEAAVGGLVTTAESQPGGFSSGGADRLILDDGRRLFAKSISQARNSGTFELHSREAAVVRDLPPGVPAPRVIAQVERDDWLVVAFHDLEGRHPDSTDTALILETLRVLPPADGLMTLPRLADELTPDASSWERLIESGGLASADPWIQANVSRLNDAAATLPIAAEGNHLVHLDCRADNLLIDSEQRVWLVDWPWASIGAPWFDAVTYLLDTHVRDPAFNPQRFIEHRIFGDAPRAGIDAVLAGLAGSWMEILQHPAPDDMPTLRDFQRQEATAALRWLQLRWT